MKGWLNALKEYSNNKNVTECPFCHRKNVEVLEHKGKRNSTFMAPPKIWHKKTTGHC